MLTYIRNQNVPKQVFGILYTKVNVVGKFVVGAYKETSIRHIGLEPFNFMFKEMKSVFYELHFVVYCGIVPWQNFSFYNSIE